MNTGNLWLFLKLFVQLGPFQDENFKSGGTTYLLSSQKIKMTILVFLPLDKKAEPYLCRPVGVVITRAEVYDV